MKLKHAMNILLSITFFALAACGSNSNSSALTPSTPTQTIAKNICIVESRDPKNSNTSLPIQVEIDLAQLNDTKTPYVPLYNSQGPRIWTSGSYVISGPTLPENYSQFKMWQWIVYKMTNGNLGFLKLYFTDRANEFIEGPQFEFTKFNKQITFDDSDNTLRISCNISNE